MKVIPPEVIDNIVEILGYVFTAAVGWLTRWLQGKGKEDRMKKEALRKDSYIDQLEKKNK